MASWAAGYGLFRTGDLAVHKCPVQVCCQSFRLRQGAYQMHLVRTTRRASPMRSISVSDVGSGTSSVISGAPTPSGSFGLGLICVDVAPRRRRPRLHRRV
jgi:hypothetical protein